MILCLLGLLWWSTMPGELHTTAVCWLMVTAYCLAMVIEGDYA